MCVCWWVWVGGRGGWLMGGGEMMEEWEGNGKWGMGGGWLGGWGKIRNGGRKRGGGNEISLIAGYRGNEMKWVLEVCVEVYLFVVNV